METRCPLHPQLPSHQLRLVIHLLPPPSNRQKHTIPPRCHNRCLLLPSHQKQGTQAPQEQNLYRYTDHLRSRPVYVLRVSTHCLIQDKKTKENHFHPEKKWIGFLLLVVAIIFDALFSDSQAYCKSTFSPTQNQLFLASNLYAFVLIFVFALLSGELTQSLAFCIDHPSVLKDLFSISLLQIVSQVSVYYVISNFKQHIYPLISTVRKVLTVFLSIFLFSHSVKLSQWFAIIIVFLAMGYELYD